MKKMVIQAVLFSAMAIFFIATKSDGLRTAAQTGDVAHLQNSGTLGQSAATLAGALGGGKPTVEYKAPDRGWDPYAEEKWHQKLAKYDPRKLWGGGSKTLKVTPKTVKVADQPQGDMATALAAKGIDPATVTVVKLK